MTRLRLFVAVLTMPIVLALFLSTTPTTARPPAPVTQKSQTKPTPTPSNKPVSSPTASPGTPNQPSQACSELSPDLNNIENALLNAAFSTTATVNDADRTHYWALPWNASFFNQVDRDYNLSSQSVRDALGETVAVYSRFVALEPQLNSDQRSAASDLFAQITAALVNMGNTSQQGLILRRTIAPQNTATLLQIGVTLFGLSGTANNKAYIAILGGGGIQNFITTRTNEGSAAYTTITDPSNDPNQQVANTLKPMAAWIDACSPDSTPSVKANPPQLVLNGTAPGTLIISEAGFKAAFQVVADNQKDIKVTRIQSSNAFDVTAAKNAKGSATLVADDLNGHTLSIPVYYGGVLPPTSVQQKATIHVDPNGPFTVSPSTNQVFVLTESGFNGTFDCISEQPAIVSVSETGSQTFTVAPASASATGTTKVACFDGLGRAVSVTVTVSAASPSPTPKT